jgi:hypothetical protein
MPLGWHSLQLPQRPLPIAAVIQEMTKVHTSFMEVCVDSQGTADLPTRSDIITKPVERVAEGRRGFGTVGTPSRRLRKHIPAFAVHGCPIQRPSHGQHELDVVIESERSNLIEEAQRLRSFSETEKGFAEPHQSVFMRGIKHRRTLERVASPSILLPNQSCIPKADVEFYGVRMHTETLFQHLEGPIIVAVIVELVRLLVVFL